MARIFMIGAGNVATHLSQALQKNGHEITQVYSKTQTNAATLSKNLDVHIQMNYTILNLAILPSLL